MATVAAAAAAAGSDDFTSNHCAPFSSDLQQPKIVCDMQQMAGVATDWHVD